MVKDQSGKWMAYEVNEDVHHNCQQPYYEQPPNNKTRDKSMAPVSKPVPPPKDQPLKPVIRSTGTFQTIKQIEDHLDMAKSKWEERNKEIQDMQVDKKVDIQKATPTIRGVKMGNTTDITENDYINFINDDDGTLLFISAKKALDILLKHMDDPQQILITELSKQTHLLNEILQVLTKDEVDEND